MGRPCHRRVVMERDLAALLEIVTARRRAEYERRGSNRLAQQIAILDLSELWRVELVGWGKETAGGSFSPS